MALIIGTNGSDVLHGTSGNDTFIGDPHVGGGGERVVSANVGSNFKFLPNDGTKIVFSTFTSLVAGDTDTNLDVYFKDIVSGQVTLLSSGSLGAQFGADIALGGVSPNGKFLTFTTTEFINFTTGPRPTQSTHFKNIATGQTFSIPGVDIGGSMNAVFSPDGKSAMFSTSNNTLVPGDVGGRDVFLINLQTGALSRVSVDAAGQPLSSRADTLFFSPDGNTAFFTVGNGELYTKNLTTGVTSKIALSLDGTNQIGGFPSEFKLSPDGKKVLFQAAGSNFVAGDTNGQTDLFIKDLVTGAVTRVSTTSQGAQADRGASLGQFSADGSKILFQSASSNFAPGDIPTFTDIFVKDLLTGQVTLVSSTATGTYADGESIAPIMSPDGTKVIFTTNSRNLDPNDSTAPDYDVYLKDLVTGSITLLSSGEFTQVQTSDYQFSADSKSLFYVRDGVLLSRNPGTSTSGPDTFNGGAGVDTVSYAKALNGVRVNLLDVSGLSNSGDAYGDKYNSIEQFRLSNFNDTFIGASAATAVNIAYGGSGNDTFTARGTSSNRFFGEDGNDTFNAADGSITAYGGDGNDTFNGWSLADTFHGGNGNDTAFGGWHNDILNGGAGNDYIDGGASKDIITGGDGDDVLIGSWDNDFLRGGNGVDRLTGDHADDRLYGEAGNDMLEGGIGADRLYGGTGDDILYGNEHNDVLNGEDGNDSLVGGDGTDTLSGGAGVDVLRGGLGNDRLTGGTGIDTFRFGESQFGRDIITDFEDGVDRISITTALADQLADLTITGNGTNSVTVGIGGQTIVVKGVHDITLSSSDFIFG